MEPRRILVVANQTACGDELLEAVRARMAAGPCRFTLLVPATPPHEHATWTEGDAKAIARGRMAAAVERFLAEGAAVEGVVGDANPVRAIDDVLHRAPARRDHPVDAAAGDLAVAEQGPAPPRRAALRPARDDGDQSASADGVSRRLRGTASGNTLATLAVRYSP